MPKLHTFVSHQVQKDFGALGSKSAKGNDLDKSIQSELYRFESHIICTELVRARALFHYLKYKYLCAIATRVGLGQSIYFHY